MSEHQHYYVPEQSHWPIVGSVGLCLLALGAVGWFQAKAYGPYTFLAGTLTMIWMLYGWFSNVVNESQKGLYSDQMDKSFRWGMVWFIFSEVMFFAAFFGALLYVRQFAVPWLGGEGDKAATNELLWQGFISNWPLTNNPDPEIFPNPGTSFGWKWLPAINTAILLTSSVTITIAHHALRAANRFILNLGLAATILLGSAFLSLQAYEYIHAYGIGLKLNTGIYGTTFFMLTGFHGAHVTIGTIMLVVMFLRCLAGHFTNDDHFAFEATAWYWHFVDVVWLLLFVFVYIL